MRRDIRIYPEGYKLQGYVGYSKISRVYSDSGALWSVSAAIFAIH